MSDTSIKTFESVVFDNDRKVMKVLDGSVGEYLYTDIIKCEILNEHAKYRGKEKPFTHTIINGRFQGCMFDHTFFVGLKVTLKDDTELAIYVSKVKTYRGTDIHLKDWDTAKEIKEFIDKIIEKYNS